MRKTNLYIDDDGKSQKDIISYFSYTDNSSKNYINNYIKSYVEKEIDVWQKKDEFEKTSDYRLRVTVNSRKLKAIDLQKEAERHLLEVKCMIPRFDLGNYPFPFF